MARAVVAAALALVAAWVLLGVPAPALIVHVASHYEPASSLPTDPAAPSAAPSPPSPPPPSMPRRRNRNRSKMSNPLEFADRAPPWAADLPPTIERPGCAAGESSTPNVVHQVWLGGGKLMFAKLVSVLSVRYLLRPEQHFLHYDEPPTGDCRARGLRRRRRRRRLRARSGTFSIQRRDSWVTDTARAAARSRC